TRRRARSSAPMASPSRSCSTATVMPSFRESRRGARVSSLRLGSTGRTRASEAREKHRMSPAPNPPPPSSAHLPAAPTFEEAVKRLTEIVQTLERGDLPLEESLRLFEEGVRLSRVSQERLDAAQKKVEQLLGVDAQGRARTEAFQTQAAGSGDDDKLPF